MASYQSHPTYLSLPLIMAVVLFAGCGKKTKTLFESLPASKTGVSFVNKLPQREGLNILYYLYYYEGGGVALGDVNNDSLPDIYFTSNSRGQNKLYLNKGNFQFEDVTDKAGVKGSSDWCSGVTMADVNADGLLDIYVSAVSKKLGLAGHNELFINNGNGTFTERSAEYGLNLSCYTVQTAFFDYDHDGDLDCFVLNQSDRPFQNIVDTSNRKKFDPMSGDRLLRNDLNTPSKKFTDVSAAAGISQSNLGYGLGLAVADINNDGWDDVYVGNDFHENDYYYVNNGNGTFTESGAKHFRHYSRFSMGNDVADYNNDGQLDIVTADMLPDDEKILKTYGSDENADIYQFKITGNGFQHQYSKNCLQRNNGDGSSFSETSLLSGMAATDWSWTALFADYDNDGNKDLFFTSGVIKRTTDLDYVRFISDAYVRKKMDKSVALDDTALSKMPDGRSHCYLFQGDGDLRFSDESDKWGLKDDPGYFTGAAYADLDNDGDLDMVVNSINSTARIFRNATPPKNYLNISFKGDSLNPAGIGTKAWLFYKTPDEKSKMQFQQLMTTRGFQSSSEPRMHFGLDSLESIDSILIVWPDQRFQTLKNIRSNQFLTIAQSNASGKFDHRKFFPLQKPWLNAVEQSPIPWKHNENGFVDFNNQYLIPHEESTRGPKIAVADVNGDGLPDVYTCGAKDQPGALWLQLSSGKFVIHDTAIFNRDAACEDVDAVFFDANGDSAPDLYVVSGGNEYSGEHMELPDRLYINDGKGNFSKSAGELPLVFENKSCVATADIDKDGDQDIFSGTLANAAAYGVPQTSHLFINDGKGTFHAGDKAIINLDSIGIVTTAVFADLNDDGWPDLVVAGEWMPITVFMNEKGTFKKSELNQSGGIWQTVFVDDVNGDGKQDILAGNWGWNNKFYSGKNGPCKLYVADFDKNGKTEQLLSYTKDGIEYPFLAKDETERQLPLLKKHYLLYSDYAGVAMKDVFYGWVDNVKPFVADRLGSVVCYGDGSGKFKMVDLPPALQLAPIFSFQKMGLIDGKNVYIAGGNFFDVIPYEGRYDAQALALFACGRSDMEKNNIVYWPQPLLSAFDGQVRDIKWLKTVNNRNLLAVASNNKPLNFFELNK